MEGHSSDDQNYGGDYDPKVVDNNCSSYSQRYKGVVAQHNGHWGAQIYTKNQRIWLGTFKSEIDAAIAYDRASIKLVDAPQNFPWTKTTLQEESFQSLYDTGRILAMIKDGSYQSKFDDFRRQTLGTDNNCDYNNLLKANYGYSCRLLFQKELTPSDVGKLNRLVIPKKYAERYFPKVPADSEGFANDEVHLSFYDTQKRLWKFRYCYWKSSQSFVFAKGWNQFVKEKKLMATDKITFYEYYHENPDLRFWVIDTCLSSRNIMGTNLKLGFCEADEISLMKDDDHTRMIKDETTIDDQTTSNDNNIVKTNGLKLFGVQIIG
uniref:AP2/ERF and B3 domain-containing transcription factor At1g50680-like n=1 Tax=Erigeron canadensis TaxID=72917 RepID=UPI001CB8E3A6|nr:AP2/ERF and B3 domain-containing transcription factor At1g50680-like [Erigeron canadensis]